MTNYVIVPMALLDVGTYELAVYCSLLSYAHGSPPQATPSHRQLCTRTRISPSRVKVALARLRDTGWITWEQQTTRGGGAAAHKYTLHGSPQVQP